MPSSELYPDMPPSNAHEAADLANDLRLFVGPNVGEYERLIAIYAAAGEDDAVGYKPSFALTGLFVPWVWLLYRKMYMPALAAFFLQFSANAIGVGLLGALVVGIVTMVYGKTFYIRQAVTKIRDIRTDPEFNHIASEQRAKEHIQKQGGTHRWVWIVGGLLYATIFISAVLALLKI